MKDGVTWQQVHSYTKFSGDTGAEERIKRQTSIPGIEPGPSDWESSAPSDKTLPGTKVCLPILPYMLCYSVNIPLTDHLNLVLSEPL